MLLYYSFQYKEKRKREKMGGIFATTKMIRVKRCKMIKKGKAFTIYCRCAFKSTIFIELFKTEYVSGKMQYNLH